MACTICKKIEVPSRYSAQDKHTFAYKTIKDRLPVILVKLIDFLHRQRNELHKFGGTIAEPTDAELKEIDQDTKDIIKHITKLRKDVETNKPAEKFEKLELRFDSKVDFDTDVEQWNKELEANRLEDGSLPRWFDSAWLLVECYMYRRIKDAMLRSKHLKMFDPFVEQKQAACRAALPQMSVIVGHLLDFVSQVEAAANRTHSSERSEFGLFMQLALWANKSDLSISGMSADKIQAQHIASNIRDSLEDLEENILCNNMSELWFRCQSIKDEVTKRAKTEGEKKPPVYIDLVADNSGYELFVDLCLVHFLTVMLNKTTANDVLKIRFHVKRMPWFVSDALEQDVSWLLAFMKGPEQEEKFKILANKWENFFANGDWTLYQHHFWTLPNDYNDMRMVSPDLYDELKNSSLIIFKGDLNYRKLTGDRKWHLLTPFRNAIRCFHPAPILTLRTIKADVVAGIEDINIFAKVNNNELPRDWKTSGNFGLIQFVDPI